MKSLWTKRAVAGLLAGLAAGTCPGADMVLDRQGSWALVQSGEGTTQTLWLEREGSDGRVCLATVEVPSVTVTNVYWDEFAGWDAQGGKAVGGMVTNVETIADEFTFRAFVNDGAVYWEDRADGVARLWSAPCKSPEAKTLLAAGDAGGALGTSTFDAEPLNRGAAWREAGADGETLAVFENGETKRLSGEEAVAFNKKVIRKGVEEYETDHGYYVYLNTFSHDGWYGDIQRQQTVVVPDGVTRIGMGLFYGCTNLASVTIPDSVASIGDYAFYGCSGLTNVVIGNGVTSIGGSAFEGCCGLTSVTIPDSVTSIGYEAFRGCRGLTSVTMGNGLTSIGNYAFFECSGLTAVHIHDLAAWCGIAFSYKSNPLSYVHHLYLNGEEITDLIIPDSVTSIGEYAFSDCSGLTSVVIGNDVTSIGDHAFSGCRGLASVTIPDSVTSIGEYAFYDCNGLTSMAIGNGVTNIEWGAFRGCSGLTSVIIPDSVTSIAIRSFSDCRSLTSVTIGNGVTSIGRDVFSGCNGLISFSVAAGNAQYSSANGLLLSKDGTTLLLGVNGDVTIPNGVTCIGYDAFEGCIGLTSVTIPDSVTSIGASAFSDCSALTNVTIPNNVTSIEYDAFLRCRGLTRVTILGNVTNDWTDWQYDSVPFRDCTNLSTLVLGDKMTKIGACMFSDCSGLTSVTIGNGVTSIGDHAFEHCSGLTSVTIPESVTSIGYGAFSDCSGLMSVTILGNVTNVSNVPFLNCPNIATGVFGDKVTKIGSVFSGCSGLTSVSIPDSVTSIGTYAFFDCSGLTSVSIPKSVTSIGGGAFSGCGGLRCVTILGNVTNNWEWSSGPFADCTNIATLFLGDKMVKIGSYMFSGCSGLTNVTTGNSVTSIGDHAFEHCSGLTSVTIGNGVTSIRANAFYDCSGLTNISVAAGNSQYSSANGLLLNKDGTTVLLGVQGAVTIPNSVASIGYGAFSDYNGLTSVTIPDGVTSIGEYAFSRCRGLTSVTIPNSVTSIGYGTFMYCSGLKELRVPKVWTGTSMLDEVWGWDEKPEGCEIIYYEPGETGEAVAVPIEWMDTHAAEILAKNEGDYAAAAEAKAANGMRVWECYLAGLSPMDAAAEFKVKSMEFVDGQLVVTWDPDLNEGDTKQERSYVVEGAETLGGAWGATNAASRFFRVKVEMP